MAMFGSLTTGGGVSVVVLRVPLRPASAGTTVATKKQTVAKAQNHIDKDFVIISTLSHVSTRSARGKLFFLLCFILVTMRLLSQDTEIY